MKAENLEKQKEIEKKESIMNKPIINLIIGILLGAILTSILFLVFKPNNSRNKPNFSQFNNGERVRPNSDNNFERRSNRNNNPSDPKLDDSKSEEKQNENQG